MLTPDVLLCAAVCQRHQVGPTIWTVAHFTQFAKVGWRFLREGQGSGYLAGGATYVTLVEGPRPARRTGTSARSTGTGTGTTGGGVAGEDDGVHSSGGSAAGGNYSIIIDCFDLAAEAINVTFYITSPSSAAVQARVPGAAGARDQVVPGAGAGAGADGRLQQWTTTQAGQFIRQADVVPVPGADGSLSFVIQLRQGTLCV